MKSFSPVFSLANFMTYIWSCSGSDITILDIKVDYLTWNRHDASAFWFRRVITWGHKPGRRSSPRGLWNSVSDRQPKATRPPCTENIVLKWFKYRSHRKKVTKLARRRLCSFDAMPPFAMSAFTHAVEKKKTLSAFEIRLAFTRRVLLIHPMSPSARYIDCINIGILYIAFARAKCSPPFFFKREIILHYNKLFYDLYKIAEKT